MCFEKLTARIEVLWRLRQYFFFKVGNHITRVYGVTTKKTTNDFSTVYFNFKHFVSFLWNLVHFMLSPESDFEPSRSVSDACNFDSARELTQCCMELR
jgi:hypothetical protein